MNEQFKKLREHAMQWVREKEIDQRLLMYEEKFAELIVKECLSLGDVLSKHYINTHPEEKQAWLLASIADYKNEIKKHFGVEE